MSAASQRKWRNTKNLAGATSSTVGRPPGWFVDEFVPCNLCGSERAALVYRQCPDRLHGLSRGHDIVRCIECGLVRTNPRPDRASIGRLYPPGYGSFMKDTPATGIRGFVRDIARVPYTLRWGSPALPAPLPGRSRLLDIGAGTGALLEEMQRQGWEPWGIEADHVAARTAAERLGGSVDRVFIGSAEEAEFDGGGFDLVVLSHVIEHLHDPKAVLLKVRYWLSEQGTLLVRCPNIASLESRIFGHLWYGLDVPRHLHHFSKTTLSRLLVSTGFIPVRVRPHLQASSLSGSLLNLLDSKLPSALRRKQRGLYQVLYPVACVLSAFGYSPYLEVTARPQLGASRTASSL